MGKESDFNRRFRKEMAARGMKMYRVESHATEPGMPDNHYIIRDLYTSGWIEVKGTDRKTYPGPVDYRKGQVPWLMGYSQLGGHCWTVLYLVTRKQVIVIPGNQSLIAEKDVGSCHHFCVDLSWDAPWDDLFGIFVTGQLSKACRPVRPRPEPPEAA